MDVPKTTTYQFGGPRGVVIQLIISPLLTVGPLLMFNKDGWNFRIPSIPTSFNDYFDAQAAMIYLGFIFGHIVFDRLPFGKVVEGQPQRDGKRLKYRCNGVHTLVASVSVYFLALFNGYRVTIVYDKLIAVAVTGLLFAFVSSILVYIKSQIAPTNICDRGNSGIMIYDYFVGHELAPRIGNFDFKWFSFRFTLHLWIMLNLIFLTKAWETQHTIPPTLALVSLTQIYYLVDNLWFENNLLTMGDIMHEGFGYFALNGFFAFCPLMYSLQPRFLLENPNHQLSWYCLVAILSLNILGYCMYRGSNSQKNEFRKNPKSPAVAHMKTIPTENGRGLLVSGWWGICRKPNYLGDILLAFSWSLPCGFRHIMPYFYCMFITLMLLDREKTDNEYCKNKYKKSWDRYCEAVKYRIVPYVY